MQHRDDGVFAESIGATQRLYQRLFRRLAQFPIGMHIAKLSAEFIQPWRHHGDENASHGLFFGFTVPCDL